MSWANVKVIFRRELRDQLRDRRTLFTIAVLPVLMYPLLGMTMLQVAQFSREHSTTVLVAGTEHLPEGNELIQGEQFASKFCSAEEARLLSIYPVQPENILAGIQSVSSATDEQAKLLRLQELQREMNTLGIDAIVAIPAGFMAAGKDPPGDSPGTKTKNSKAKLQIFVNSANDKSRIASERLTKVFSSYRTSIVTENLEAKSVTLEEIQPFQVVQNDLASDVRKRAAIWSRILPFVVLVWALTGAFYPAIDLCAGEKERGTLETLLCSPAKRSEIVCGKLLTIISFSIATSLLNLLSMTFTGLFVINSMAGSFGGSMQIGPPPVHALGWLILVLIPIAALFSALSLAVASFARSSKEGQYYLMPLLMVVLPLLMLPMMPAAELNLGTSLIPVTGVMLLLRSLIEGRYAEVLQHVIPVIGVTICCVVLAIRWAVNQFNNESVLFRESERFGVGAWLKSVVRDRGNLPTCQMAIMCGLLLLVIRFFGSLAGQMPVDWNGFTKLTLITLIGLIATPPILMAILLTKKPLQALNLRRPPLAAIPAAIVLAFLLHPAAMAFSQMIMALYPLSDDMKAFESVVQNLLAGAPNVWMILLVMALAPAVCEEIAFRGFILRGLLQGKSKLSAIIISSLFFAAAHAILQQSLTAFVVGIVIGYVAVQSRSILPCIAYHFVHNSMLVILSLIPAWAAKFPALEYIFHISHEGGRVAVSYQLGASIVMGVLAILVLMWFSWLEPNQETESGQVTQTAESASVPV